MFNNDEAAKMQYEIEQNNEKIIDKEIQQIFRHITDTEDTVMLTEKVRNYRAEIYKIKLGLREELEDIYSKRDIKELDKMKARTERDEKVKARGSLKNWILTERTLDYYCDAALAEGIFIHTAVIESLQRCADNGISLNNRDDEVIYSSSKSDFIKIGLRVDGNDFSKYFIAQIAVYRKGKGHVISNDELKNIANENRIVEPIGKSIREKEAVNKVRDIDIFLKKEKITNKQIILNRIAEILQHYEKELSYWQEMNLIKSIENSDSEHYFD